MSPLDFLRQRLSGEGFVIGQVRVTPGRTLAHADDTEFHKISTDPYEALQIARFDDTGAFRPLKSAPNLARGWQLNLASDEEVLLALDFLYPAAIGLLAAWRNHRIWPVPLRETLARQTGMYAVVKNLTDDEAAALIRETCNPLTGCLRRILWPIAPGQPGPRTEASVPDFSPLPVLCAEACNLLVAAGRGSVKALPGTD